MLPYLRYRLITEYTQRGEFGPASGDTIRYQEKRLRMLVASADVAPGVGA